MALETGDSEGEAGPTDGGQGNGSTARLAAELRQLWLLDQVWRPQLAFGKAAELSGLLLAQLLGRMNELRITPFDLNPDYLEVGPSRPKHARRGRRESADLPRPPVPPGVPPQPPRRTFALHAFLKAIGVLPGAARTVEQAHLPDLKMPLHRMRTTTLRERAADHPKVDAAHLVTDIPMIPLHERYYRQSLPTWELAPTPALSCLTINTYFGTGSAALSNQSFRTTETNN